MSDTVRGRTDATRRAADAIGEDRQDYVDDAPSTTRTLALDRLGALERVLDEQTLLEVQLAAREGGRVRVVRHHHDRLVELLVKRREDVHDLLARARVQV